MCLRLKHKIYRQDRTESLLTMTFTLIYISTDECIFHTTVLFADYKTLIQQTVSPSSDHVNATNLFLTKA